MTAKIIFHRPLFLILICTTLLCLVSCRSTVVDPCYLELVPCYPEEAWDGPSIRQCVLESEIDLDLKSHPLNVAEMLDIALRNSPVTRNTWARARAAASNWQASQSLLYPTVDYEGSLNFIEAHSNSTSTGVNASFQNTGSSVVGGGGSGYAQIVEHTLSASYLLLDFGGRNAAIDSARNALFAANWTHNQTLQNVMVSVLRTYYIYLADLSLIAANEDNIKETRENYEAAQLQFEAGTGTIVDVLQAKASYANALLLEKQLVGNAKTAMGQLATAMGLPANETFEVQKLPEKLPLEKVTDSIEALFEQAKTHRPDLASAYAFYMQKRADYDVAWSNGKPTISANAEWNTDVFIHTPIANNRFTSGSLVLDIPLFHGFFFKNSEKIALENMRAAYEAMIITEEQVMLDVVTAYWALVTAVETIKYSEEYLQFARESYEAAFLGYKSGITTLLNVLTAQLTLANARASLIQARTNWVTAVANLSYATGRL